MNFRLTAIFFLLVVALVAALLVVALVQEDHDTTLTDASLLQPLAQQGVTAKEVDSLELVRTEPGEEKLVFVKTAGDKWELRLPVTARVDSAAIEAVIRDLFRAKPVKYGGLSDNLTLHGLDRPTLRVTVGAGEKSETVSIGNTTVGGAQAVTFVTTSAAPKRALAVPRTDLDALFRDAARGQDGPAWQLAKWLPDYRVRRLLGADFPQPEAGVQAVKITASGQTVALSKGAGAAWKFDAPAGFGEADDLGDTQPRPNTAPFTGVRPLLNVLTTLQVASPDDWIDKPGDLKQYGLAPNDPNLIRVEIKGKSGQTDILYLGKPVQQNGKPVSPTKVYARLEGDPAVAKVQTDRAEAIRQTALHPGELRNRDLIPQAKRGRIDAIDVTVGGATTRLRKLPTGGAPGGEQWVMYGGPNDPQEARRGVVEALLTALTRPRVAREVLPKPNDAAFAGPETKATVKVWTGAVEKPAKGEAGKLPPEPKLKGSPVELIFGKKEGDTVYVRKVVDGARADMKLPVSELAQVTKTRLDFVDPRLTGFTTQDAVRLAFNRGTTPFEVQKNEAAGTWAYLIPPAKKGKPAGAAKVSGLLGLLAALYAEQVVAESASPDELRRHGLNPPRMKVTVTLKGDKDNTRVYEFGNETEDKRHVYARQEGRPVLFTVRKDVYTRFATDDLRDPVVYRVDPAKVKRVKLRGWKGVVGPNPLVYLFERKGDGWGAVSPPTPAGFTPDPAKVNALLAAVAAPKAEAFVDVGAKPQYGLDVAQNPNALEITLEVEGEPARTLVLGNKVGSGPQVYAASSGVPGEVFTLAPAAIQKFTDKPASLQLHR